LRRDGQETGKEAMITRRALATPLMAAPLLAMPLTASAQDWPGQPIRMIMPYAAGGPTDLTPGCSPMRFRPASAPG